MLLFNRAAHVDFDVAVFTNITRDHLDYHGDMNAIKAKKMLFRAKKEAVAIFMKTLNTAKPWCKTARQSSAAMR